MKNRFWERSYSEGIRKPASLWSDFEEWRSGMHGWIAGEGILRIHVYHPTMKSPSARLPTPEFRSSANYSPGLQSDRFELIGPLNLTSGNLLFNTTSVTVDRDVQLDGIHPLFNNSFCYFGRCYPAWRRQTYNFPSYFTRCYPRDPGWTRDSRV